MLILPDNVALARTLLAQQLETHRSPPGGDLSGVAETAPAAVLVPIVLHPGGPTVLFTRRTEGLTHHAGQISFPGGRMEAGETPEAAALREACEEIGLAPEQVLLAGRLAHYTTITRFLVTPVVGLVTPGFSLTLQAGEVAEVFEVPLSVIVQRTHYRALPVDTATRRIVTQALDWEGRTIWGATAGMLLMLQAALYPLTAEQEPTA